MTLTFLESFLPGTRRLRPVLFAGFLWTVALWVVISDALPTRAESSGFSKQAYAVADYLGSLGVTTIALVLIFVVGALTSPIHSTAANLLGSGLRRWSELRAWQKHAQARREALIAQTETTQARIEDIDRLLGLPVEQRGKAGTNRTDGYLRNQRANLEKTLSRGQASLAALPKRKAGRRPGRIRYSAKTRAAIGDPPVDLEHSVEFETMRDARNRGAELYLDKVDSDEPLEVALGYARDSDLAEFAQRLRDELEPDPLDMLQALDESLFLELDRQRAEREVRLAVSAPVMFLGIFLAFEYSLWACGLAVGAAILFATSALAESNERSRVVNLIRIRGLEPPSVKAAVSNGRDEVRQHLQQLARDRRERERQERQDAASQSQAQSAQSRPPGPSDETKKTSE